MLTDGETRLPIKELVCPSEPSSGWALIRAIRRQLPSRLSRGLRSSHEQGGRTKETLKLATLGKAVHGQSDLSGDSGSYYNADTSRRSMITYGVQAGRFLQGILRSERALRTSPTAREELHHRQRMRYAERADRRNSGWSRSVSARAAITVVREPSGCPAGGQQILEMAGLASWRSRRPGLQEIQRCVPRTTRHSANKASF